MALTSQLRSGFIGAGKVGVSLGAYLKSKGFDVIGYFSRNLESAKNAASITSSSCLTIKELVAECNLIWITTPDDQIEKVWNELVHYELDGKLICHTSGVKDATVFTGIIAKGAFGYSVHPMRAFADKTGKIEGLETTCFTLEGDPTHYQQFKQFFRTLGNKLFFIDRKDKPMYHLANVMVTNLVLGLLSMGSEYLSQCGSFSEGAIEALLPMIENNINNLKRNGFSNALTGPVERNDLGTVIRHFDILSPCDLHIYKDLSRKILDLAVKKRPKRDYSSMLQILETAGLDYTRSN
ncbi:MAG: DUF2520 domain-containing protein [Clostridiaceae bacterium]|jgi:predicted short-subunit dehydrogenase-like oxidoreductase (DUF2520 family)|nr:DUF2520 domain-containing protein [Clostridiaceae bacterium]